MINDGLKLRDLKFACWVTPTDGCTFCIMSTTAKSSQSQFFCCTIRGILALREAFCYGPGMQFVTNIGCAAVNINCHCSVWFNIKKEKGFG